MSNNVTQKRWKRLKTTAKIVIILIILWWLLQEWETYRYNMQMIQNYMDLNNHSISQLKENVGVLQEATNNLVVKINAVQSHIVEQDNIIKQLTHNKQQLADMEKQLSTFVSNVPQVDTAKPDTSIITDIGNAAGWFTIIVSGLEMARRVVMFLPIIP